MFQRKTSGSVVCPSCGSLVGVRDDRCYNCGRVNPGLWGFAPLLRQLGAQAAFVPVVVGGSVTLYVITLLVSGEAMLQLGGLFSFLSPSNTALFLFGASGPAPVFAYNRWWTVLSAGWLHGGALHILFNMMWVRQLVPATDDVVGPARTIIIYTVAGIAGFLLSSVAGFVGLPLSARSLTVGASASIFGLLGALVHYGRRGSSWIGSQALTYAVALFVFGIVMPGIDNYAHAGGFLGGYAASAVLNPHTRERVEHMIIAIVCLAASLIAIVVSVVTGLSIFRP